MHTETDAEVRFTAEQLAAGGRIAMKHFMATAPRWDNAYRGSYRAERGSIAEYDKMKTDCAEFKQALRRQLLALEYNRLYSCVEQHCRAHRPFKDKPYNQWLGVLQAVWSRALTGELQALPHEYNDSGVQHRDAQKIQAVIQETTVKTKTVKLPKQKQTHNVIGVRFVRGHNVEKVYSYTVPKKVKLHLGEEVIVPSNFDGYETNSVAVVVALDHKTDYPTSLLKQVYGRITVVKA
jgi:hypothetical protein